MSYIPPNTPRKYTPDFYLLSNGIVIETKGRFVTADRQKIKLVKQQHPDVDLRIVFSNSRARISKKSATTYAAWCNAQGIVYADKRIPSAWMTEAPNQKSMAAIQKLRGIPVIKEK